MRGSEFKVRLVVVSFLAVLLAPAALAVPQAEERVFGNNLGVPAVFPEGIGLTGLDVTFDPGLRGQRGLLEYSVKPTDVGGMPCWPQGIEGAAWQADWIDGRRLQETAVDVVDWADTLETRTAFWYETVTVEIALSTAMPEPQQGFDMMPLWETPQGWVWGTDGVKYATNAADVFSPTARLTIQRIAHPVATSGRELIWNATTGAWEGPALRATLLNQAAWKGFGEADRSVFAGRVNEEGRLVYSADWVTPYVSGSGAWYRLTLSLDGVSSPFLSMTTFSEKVAAAPPRSGIPRYVPVALPDLSLTYVDIFVRAIE